MERNVSFSSLLRQFYEREPSEAFDEAWRDYRPWYPTLKHWQRRHVLINGKLRWQYRERGETQDEWAERQW